VAQVEPGSPAEAAGLQEGDLIKEVDRRPIRTADDLVRSLRAVAPDQSAALLVRRGDSTFFVALTRP
jgi:S1-C subfamily serine protease